MVEHMVLRVLDSFVKQDAEVARNLKASDDAVDRLRSEIGNKLIELMQSSPDVIPRALNVMFNSRSWSASQTIRRTSPRKSYFG
jgi:phosphate uptake regulator